VPLCDQPIRRDRFEEFKARIETRQAANEAAVTERLQDQFAQQIANAREQERNLATERLEVNVAQARSEERAFAEISANQKLAAAERANLEGQAAMQYRIDESERGRIAAEELRNALRAQLDQLRHDNEETIQKIRHEADANAMLIREESKRQAEAEVRAQLDELQRQHAQLSADLQARIDAAERARTAAQSSSANLQAQLEQNPARS
jgi:DNA repair exonuclease SbcCD ATPase subunit